MSEAVTIGESPLAAPARAEVPAGAPYVGLRPFSSADAAFFFGRAEERRIVAANACASRLTVLYGPSGVGKSSLLDGGVVHDLAQTTRRRSSQSPRFAAVYFREWSKWRGNPMAGVARSIHDGLKQQYGIDLDALAVDDFPATVHAWMKAQPGGLIVILDQFEEYLLYHDPHQSDSFALEFPRVLEAPELRVNFVLSLREDALGQLDRFKGSVPALLDNRLHLKLLSRSAAEDAIRKPLDELRERGTDISIENELVQAVLGIEHGVAAGSVKLGQVGEGDLPERAAVSDRPVEAPYLQLVMERIWKEERAAGSAVLRLATFERLGWAQRIVQEHLDARMAELTEANQHSAAKLFRYLVTPSGAKIALSASDLAQLTDFSEQEVLPVLEDLAQANARVLRSIAAPNDDPRERRFEIYHDALARAVLDWTTRHQKILDEQRVRDAEGRYRRERRKKIAARAAAAAFAAGVIVLLAMQFAQKRRIATESRARELAAAAVRSLDDDPQKGLLLALRAAALTYQPHKPLLPETDEALHRALLASRLQNVLLRDSTRLRALATAPNGVVLAIADEAGAVTLWDAVTERKLRTLTTTGGYVSALVFSPDSRRLLVASYDSPTRIWDLAGNHDPVRLASPRAVIAAAFHPALPLVLTADADSAARLWDAFSGAELQDYAGHRGVVWSVAFAQSGAAVVTGSSEGVSQVWERQSGRLRCDFPGDGNSVLTVAALSATGARVASGTRGSNRVIIWDPTSCTEIRKLVGHTSSIFDLNPSADGRYLASASADGSVRVWHVESGNEAFSLSGHTGEVVSVAFSPDGERLYTASTDSTVRIWDASLMESEVPVLQAGTSNDRFRGLAFNPRRLQLVALVSSPASVLFSNLRNPGASFRRDLRRLSAAYTLDVTADGTRVAVGGDEGVEILDSETGNLIVELDRENLSKDTMRIGAITAIAFSADDRFLAAGDAKGLLNVWDLEHKTGQLIHAHTDEINAIAFDPSGDRLVTGSADGRAIIWTVKPDLQPADTIRGHYGRVTAVAFSPDGNQVATAGDDRSILIQSRDNPGQVLRLSGHMSTVWSLVFNRDGSRLASAGMDRTIRVWDMKRAQERLWLPRHRGPVYTAAFSADGDYIASAGENGDIRVSIVEPATLLRRGWDKVQRSLTQDECETFHIRNCAQSTAAVIDARTAAEEGNLAKASEEFSRAKKLDATLHDLKADSMARAVAVSASIRRGRRFLRATRFAEAVREFHEARALDAERTGDVVPELVNAISQLLQTADGSVVQPAMDAYQEFVEADRTYKPTAETLNSLCWWGSLSGYAKRVSDVCEAAVKASPEDANIRDSRGVNRAITGNPRGALEDFRAFVATKQPESSKARRQRWIGELVAGRNPFTLAELAALRVE